MREHSLALPARFGVRLCLAVLILLACGRGVLGADQPLRPLSGPAHVVLVPGKSWLDLPEGYVYVTDRSAVKQAIVTNGGDYGPGDLAVVGAAGCPDMVVRSAGAPDEVDWTDVLSPKWKDRQLTFFKADQSPKGGAADLPKILSWYAEPTYSAGPPQRITMPLLVQDGNQTPGVITLGLARSSDQQLSVITISTPERQADTCSHLEAILGAVRFGPRPEDRVPMEKLNWAAGPAHVQLRHEGVSVDVPAGFVCLTARDDIFAFDAVSSNAASEDQLAVLAPADLSWNAVVTSLSVDQSPGVFWADNADPDGESGKAYLDWVQRLFVPAASDTQTLQPSFTVTGYRDRPELTGLALRSLLLPVTIRGSDGGTWAGLFAVKAERSNVVEVLSFIPDNQYEAVAAGFRTIARSVTVADTDPVRAVQPIRPPPSAPSGPPTPPTVQPFYVPPGAGRALTAVIVALFAAVWKTGGGCVLVVRSVVGFVVGVTRSALGTGRSLPKGQTLPGLHGLPAASDKVTTETA